MSEYAVPMLLMLGILGAIYYLIEYMEKRNNLKKNLERYLYDWEITDEDGVVYDFGAFWKRVSKKIKPRYITSNETVIDGHVFTVSKSYWQ